MTTIQSPDVAPASSTEYSTVSRPAPPERSGTRMWLLLLVVLAAVAIWYFVAYEPTPRVVLIR